MLNHRALASQTVAAPLACPSCIFPRLPFVHPVSRCVPNVYLNISWKHQRVNMWFQKLFPISHGVFQPRVWTKWGWKKTSFFSSLHVWCRNQNSYHQHFQIDSRITGATLAGTCLEFPVLAVLETTNHILYGRTLSVDQGRQLPRPQICHKHFPKPPSHHQCQDLVENQTGLQVARSPSKEPENSTTTQPKKM